MKTFILILFSGIALFAQNALQLDIDYAVFPATENVGIMELYYSFPQVGLLPRTDDNGEKFLEGQLHIIVQNTDSQDTVLYKRWNFRSQFDTLNNSALMGLLRFQFEAGNYHIFITGSDLNSPDKTKEIDFNFNIKPLDQEHFMISDIQLASKILQESKNTESMFYKNTLELTPNPNSIYGTSLPVIFFYSEIHNVKADSVSDKLMINHFLINQNSQVVYKKTKFVSRNNNSIVDIGAISVTKLATGVYNLIVSVSDTLAEVSRSSIKQVFLYNPDIMDTTSTTVQGVGLLASELSTKSIEELDKLYEQSEYIANHAEKKQWKKLTTLEGKRSFLFDFWSARDEDPSTGVNETMQEYFDRVKYANRQFSNFMQKEGWKTDMGRVWIMYGKPYEIERHPNEKDVKPYEIWFYSNIEGGVIFVFGDLTGFGEYRLLHSDKRGELQDPNWQHRISSQ